MININRLMNASLTRKDVQNYQGNSVKEIPTHLLRYAKPKAPMVIWNITQKCSLSCPVCHLHAGEQAAEGELTTREAENFLQDLAQMGVVMVSIYGGEPLTRPDLFYLISYAKNLGLRMILSVNGTMIDDQRARNIKQAGIDYVGINLDGLAQMGSGQMDLVGGLERLYPHLQAFRDAGLGFGVRITVNPENAATLPDVVRTLEEMGITRFALFQLPHHTGKYDWNLTNNQRRKIMEFLIESHTNFLHKNVPMEIVTEDNYVDGIFLLRSMQEMDAEKGEAIGELLKIQGGCPAGSRLVNVDHLGNVHPCASWRHFTVGNVKERPLSELWTDPDITIWHALRNKSVSIKGKCGRCDYLSLCGGCRVRADGKYADFLAEDPACYLKEEEIKEKSFV